MHSLDPVQPNAVSFQDRQGDGKYSELNNEVMKNCTDLSSQGFPLMTSSTLACPSGVDGGAPLQPSRNIFMYKLVPPTIMGSFFLE